MSQYLSISVKFIYCISLNVLIILCDNNHQNLNISGFNESLIIDKNFDSNSYYLFKNGLLVSNSTNVKYKGRYITEGTACNSKADCDSYYPKCCFNKCTYFPDNKLCKSRYKSLSLEQNIDQYFDLLY